MAAAPRYRPERAVRAAPWSLLLVLGLVSSALLARAYWPAPTTVPTLVTVEGQVPRPGTYALARATVFAAIRAAGGTPEGDQDAFVPAGHKVIVTDGRGLIAPPGDPLLVAIPVDPSLTALHAGDRMILSCRPKGIAHTRSVEGLDLLSDLQFRLEQIAAHEGSLVEAVVMPQSSLIGQSVRSVNFRQRFRMVAVALHRKGRNVRSAIETLPIEPGDVLLMMGTDQAVDRLRNSDDLMLFDRARTPTKSQNGKVALVLGVIAAVIFAASFGIAPIEVAAVTGCVVLLIAGVLKSKEAYASVEWNLIFLIFGMLGMGLALERTGAASWLASQLVDGVNGLASTQYRPLLALAAIYLTTTFLTEILSNNAIAALMAPIALRVASEMGIDPRPFIVGVTFAASAAFCTPIGYQTNTYVYGVGGYRFTDFLKIGLPMNAMCFGMAMTVIPIIWPFLAV